MSAPTRDEVRKMAREAGTPDPMVFSAAYERLVAAAYARGVADERQRIEASATTLYEKSGEALDINTLMVQRNVLRGKA